MSFRAASFVLASLFLSPASGAQQQPLQPVEWNPNVPPCLPFLPANVIDWPDTGFGDPAGFGRTLVAELDRDFAPEAIVNCSGAVTVLWCAAVLEAPRRIYIDSLPDLESVADIALLPGEGADGSDAILVTDDHGLRKVFYTPPIPGTPYSVPEAFHGSAPIEPTGTGDWSDAYPIRVEQLDGEHGLDVVGVATDHRTIMTLTRNAAGDFVAGPMFTAPSNVRDVAVVNFDGQGGRELVALTLRGLVIYRIGGGDPISPVMHLDATGCIARFAAPSAPGGELLAWTRRKLSNPTESELKVIGSIGTTLAPQTLTFATPCQDDKSVVPVALAAGDYDEGAGEELLIAHETDHTAIILANLDEAPWFDVDDTTRFDIAALSGGDISPTSNVGMPAFAQLDGQTAEDLVIPVDEQVIVLTELPHVRAFPEATTTTFFRSSDIVFPDTEFGFGELSPSPTPGVLRFAYWIPDTNAYDQYTHLKMTLWHQENGNPFVYSQAIYHQYHSLASLDGDEERLQWVTIEHDFPPGTLWDPRHYFYTQYRFVKWDGIPGHAVDAASPIFTGGLTLPQLPSSEFDFFDYLLQNGGIPDTAFPLVPDNNLDGDNTQNGSTFIGAYVPMSSQPPFQANVTLTFPSLTVGGGANRVGDAPPE